VPVAGRVDGSPVGVEKCVHVVPPSLPDTAESDTSLWFEASASPIGQWGPCFRLIVGSLGPGDPPRSPVADAVNARRKNRTTTRRSDR
jgi:hypothetical protein